MRVVYRRRQKLVHVPVNDVAEAKKIIGVRIAVRDVDESIDGFAAILARCTDAAVDEETGARRHQHHQLRPALHWPRRRGRRRLVVAGDERDLGERGRAWYNCRQWQVRDLVRRRRVQDDFAVGR